MDRKWPWVAGAIVAMWTAVLLIGLFTPTLVTDTVAGDHVEIPAAVIIVGFLAFIATIVVASVGFRDEGERFEESRVRELEVRVADTEARLGRVEEQTAPTAVALRAQR